MCVYVDDGATIIFPLHESKKKHESNNSLSVNSTMILSSSYITKAQMNACACRFHIFAYSPPCFSNPSCVPASTTTESFMYLYMSMLDS